MTRLPDFELLSSEPNQNLVEEASALYAWLADSQSGDPSSYPINLFALTLNAAASARLAGDRHLEGILLGKSRDFGVLKGELLLRYVAHQRELRSKDEDLIRDAIVGLSEAADSDTYNWCRRELLSLATTDPDQAAKLRRLSTILGLTM